VQKEAALCAKRVVVTVEEIVDALDARPGAVVLPHWTIDYVSVVPNGAHPSYTHDYTQRDNDFYVGWDAISRNRDTFLRWMDDHVLSR
jgi:glutaconate CoA-transferase subunit A